MKRSQQSSAPVHKVRRAYRVVRCAPLRIEAHVAQLFNAYAAAADPREIGGLLRVVEDGAGGWCATDLAIPPQVVSRETFELDGVAVARWCLGLAVAGREEEIGDWRALIHSHPAMAPRPSARDLATLGELAGQGGFAFSVIVASGPDPRRNSHACHFAQGRPVALLATDIGVESAGDGSLSGVEALSTAELQAIDAHVERLLGPWPGHENGRGRRRPAGSDARR